MPDSLGPVEVQFTIPADFGKEADAAIKKMAGLTDAATNMPKASKAAVLEQKEIIKTIEADIKQLEKALKDVAPGNAKQEILGDLTMAKRALAEETAALKQAETQANATGASKQRLMFQIRDMTDAMAKMRVAGQQDSQEFKEMELKASELNKQLLQTRQAMRSLSDDQRGIKGITEGVSGLSGAFSAGVGAIGLFAGENENLQKIQTKVQSLMAITIGLQQVANVLDGESAFMSVTVARAKELWATAEKGLTAALWGSNVAAKALMITMTGGLALAIPVLISLYESWNEKQADAIAAQKEAMRVTTEANIEAGKARIEIDLTIAKIESFNGSKEAEKRMVEEVNKKYGDTFGTYKTLAGWLDVLKTKAADYVQVMFLQAKTQGYVNDANNASKSKEEAIGTPAREATIMERITSRGDSWKGIGQREKQQNIDKYEALYRDAIEKAEAAQNELIEWQKKSGINPGSETKPGKPASDKIEKAEEEKTYYLDLLDEFKTYQEKRTEIEQIYNAKIAKLTADGFADKAAVAAQARDKELKALDDEQPLAKLLEKYKTYETQIKEVTENSQKEILALKAAGKNAEAEMAQKAADKKISGIKMQQLKMSDAFGKLWEDVGTMTGQQIKEIIDTANQNLADLDPEQLVIVTELIEKLGKKLDDISNKAGKSGGESFNENNPFAVIANSIKAFNSTDPDVDKVKEIEKAFAAAAQAVNELLGAAAGAVDIMADLGVLSGKEAEAMKETVNQIGGVVAGGMSIAAGIMTGNPVQVITGVVQAAGNLVKLLDFKGKKTAKDQSAITAEIGNMEKAYKKLDKAVENALGNEKYTLQREQYKLNVDEMAKYEELIALEMQKKKKKRNQEDIDAWNEAIAQLQDSNLDITNSITEQLTQTNVADFSNEIANSIVGAFDAGTDATLAWGDVVNNVMRNAVINAMKLKYLEKPMKDAIAEMEKGMDDGRLNAEEAAKVKAIIEGPAAQFTEAVTSGLTALGFEPGAQSGSSPASKSSFSNMKEETGSALLGQFTALRMSNAIIADIAKEEQTTRKSMLQSLQEIAENTSYCRKLENMDKVLTRLENDGIKIR